MTHVPGFTGSPLERIDHERDRPEALAAHLADPRALLLLLDGLEPMVTDHGLLGWTPLSEFAEIPVVLLGLIDGAPRFAALSQAEGSSFRSPRLAAALDRLTAAEAGVYATARSLIDWHARHGFCARCGRPSEVMRAGWARLCPTEKGGCGAEHFPRTDPVVIMLADYGGKALVGRQHNWPAGRYSALAGFIEVGESIEAAVARELFEEAGVRATGVRYIVSQPWPFPSQLMIACVAEVDGDALNLDSNELEAARWVSRDEVAAALAGEPDAAFLAPPHYAIAHTLFRQWLDEA